jgi:hypothetical protein
MDKCWLFAIADEFWEKRLGKMLLAWPVPTCTACCSRIGSRQILSIFQIRPNLRSPTAFGRKMAMSQMDKCWLFAIADEFWEKRLGKMLLAWPVPTCTACCSRIGSRQILSNSVNLSNPRGPRQRLVEKRLCPRWTNVDYLLLRISFEKNGRGKCCWPGPSRRTHHVAAESAPVKFCQFFKSGQIWGPRQRLVGKQNKLRKLRIALTSSKINFFAVRKLFLGAVTIQFDLPHAQWPCHVSKRHSSSRQGLCYVLF